jgi:CheY-like chemotaxis protein
MLLLIADDDRDAAETLAELLQLLVPPPIEILLAFDGKEALAAATTCNPPPDAVILDIEMPHMDGANAAVGIRAALGTAPTIIAVTGHVGMTRLAEASGAFDHTLVKPANVDELLRLLRRR